MDRTDTRTAPAVRRRHGRRGRRIAVVVWLILVLALAVGAAVSFVDHSSKPADQDVPATGGTVVLAGPGEYSVYAESDVDRHPTPDGDGRVVTDPEYGPEGTEALAGPWAQVDAVVGPSGTPVALTVPDWSESYRVDERTGMLVARFAADQGGVYTVRGHGDGTPPGDRLVVSVRDVRSLVLGIVLSVAAFLVLVGGGVGFAVLAAIGHARRTRAAGPGRWGPGSRPPGGTLPGSG